MGLFRDFVSQTRKPEGLLGKMMLSGMNSGHAKMADWGTPASAAALASTAVNGSSLTSWPSSTMQSPA